MFGTLQLVMSGSIVAQRARTSTQNFKNIEEVMSRDPTHFENMEVPTSQKLVVKPTLISVEVTSKKKWYKDADNDGRGDLDFDELRTLIKESFAKSYLDDDTNDHFNEKEITAMAYYLMRAADENLDDRILEQREKTPEELKNSTISLHEWQELSTTGVFTFKDLKCTSKEQLEAAGWKKSIFPQRVNKK